ncbi:hypothetical protein IKF04_02465 [Candidatus Saccharibacteria bacterium]|nr:hypothetical protein [Candidatus Saccharibacteria bacterium]
MQVSISFVITMGIIITAGIVVYYANVKAAFALVFIMIVFYLVFQVKKSPEGLLAKEEHELSRKSLAETTAQITVDKCDIVEYEESGMPYCVTVEVTRTQRYVWLFFCNDEESIERLTVYHIPRGVRVVYRR